MTCPQGSRKPISLWRAAEPPPSPNLPPRANRLFSSPFAAAADDHQTRNAEELVKIEAAVMLKESDLADHRKVLECLVQLLTSRERLNAMSAAALTQSHPQAAQEIAERLVSLATN